MRSLIVASIAAASSAHAVTLLSGDIDFRSPAWSVVDGQLSPQSVGDVTLVASVALGFNNGVFSHSTTSGIGIEGTIFAIDDEVGILELLSIAFSNGSGNGLTGVWITDLYDETYGGLFPFAELGFYSFDLVSWVPFSGTSVFQSNGELYVPFGSAIDASIIHFAAQPDFVSDFSVAGFTKLSADPASGQVPDSGGTMILLGGTLLGLSGVRRFLTAKK